MLLKELRKLKGIEAFKIRVITKDGDYVDDIYVLTTDKPTSYEDCEIEEFSMKGNKANITVFDDRQVNVKALFTVSFQVEVEVNSKKDSDSIYRLGREKLKGMVFNFEEQDDVKLEDWSW